MLFPKIMLWCNFPNKNAWHLIHNTEYNIMYNNWNNQNAAIVTEKVLSCV